MVYLHLSNQAGFRESSRKALTKNATTVQLNMIIVVTVLYFYHDIKFWLQERLEAKIFTAFFQTLHLFQAKHHAHLDIPDRLARQIRWEKECVGCYSRTSGEYLVYKIKVKDSLARAFESDKIPDFGCVNEDRGTEDEVLLLERKWAKTSDYVTEQLITIKRSSRNNCRCGH